MFTRNFKHTGLLTAIAILALALMAFVQPQTASAATNSTASNGAGPGGHGFNQNSISLPQTQPQPQQQQPPAQTPAKQLSNADEQALLQAIQEKYDTLNQYKNAKAEFGNSQRLTKLIKSVQKQLDELLALARSYGIDVPANPGLNGEPAPRNQQAACAIGAALENNGVTLYNKLILSANNTELVNTFKEIRDASLYDQLPAFQACK